MRDLPEDTNADPKHDEQPTRVTQDKPPQIDPQVEEAIRRQRQAMGFT